MGRRGTKRRVFAPGIPETGFSREIKSFTRRHFVNGNVMRNVLRAREPEITRRGHGVAKLTGRLSG